MSTKPARHSSSGKASKRHHPYNDAMRPQACSRFGRASKDSSSPHISPSIPSYSVAPSETTVRETFMEIIRQRHPPFKPRTDFDIYTLASTEYKGPPSGLYTWLDGQLALCLATSGDFDTVMSRTSELLDGRGTITGRKPKPGAPDVFLRPIPSSQYSIRLFPGSLAHREYCMDFVLTSTGHPVNSPFKFELWVVPSSSTPWLGGLPMRIHSLERVYGYQDAKISPGVEKFLLKDGQTCLLKRPGHRNLRFTVPIRAAALEPADVNEDQLHFPQVIR
ncbi:hypothetical protein LXA43DRAFT_1103894 [Ganoderma leucocontextum]|nr:hypothetical protein LXA43DRAFT_1103894 [Ganoderma leucocontextum]